jgi:molybdopterin-guanine dinucleotide biosynthesis protein B
MRVLAFFGYSNSGKTAVLSEVISKLSDMGYRVGVVKHSDKNFQVDVEGKDSHRLYNAGADVFVLSPVKMAMHTHDGLELEDAVRYLDGCDILLAEGFKKSFRDGVMVVKNREEFEDLTNTVIRNENKSLDKFISPKIHLVICLGENIDGLTSYRVVSSDEIDKIVEFVVQFFKKV